MGVAPVPRDAAGSHCPSCGRPVEDCAGCRRELDPPRFCHRCGTRLAVRVSPGGFAGRCKHHGLVVDG